MKCLGTGLSRGPCRSISWSSLTDIHALFRRVMHRTRPRMRPGHRRETMKIMLRAAFAALSIASIGTAYADGGDGPIANTQFTEIPGVIAQAPVRNAPPVATAQNGQVSRVY